VYIIPSTTTLNNVKENEEEGREPNLTLKNNPQ
jgi:hypothetical protein